MLDPTNRTALDLSSWPFKPLVLSSFLDGAKSHDRTSRVQAPDLTARPITFSKDDRLANSPYVDDNSPNQIQLSPGHLREISRRERQVRNRFTRRKSVVVERSTEADIDIRTEDSSRTAVWNINKRRKF